MNEITYALNAENKLVNVNDAPNGEDCNCFCPKCHAEMVAKNNGKVRVHHFAHASKSECIGAYQTMIHLLAKEIVCETRILPLAQNGKLLAAAEVWLEEKIDEIIPDVLGIVPITYNGTNQVIGYLPIIVEIYVTHKVDNIKAEKIKKLGIPAVEVNLSKTEALTKDELVKEIYNTKNWRLITTSVDKKYLPKIQVDLSGVLAQYKALMASSNSSSYGRQTNNYRRNYRYNNRGRRR